MTFADWQSAVPSALTSDPIWKMEAYRIGLFVSDLAWSDSTKLLKDGRTRSVADQLFRASSRITACITEGYSRASGRDRARFYEYAMGSAREARDWYFKGRPVLSEKVAAHRIDYYTQLVRLLTRMIQNERKKKSLERPEETSAAN